MTDLDFNDQLNDIDINNDINDDELWDIFDRVSKDVKKQEDIYDSTSSIENICSECSSENIIFEQSMGTYNCKDCGNTVSQYIDKSPEWNTFDDNGTEATRCGAPTNIFLPQSSLGTKIGGKGAARMKMLQKWNQMPYRERSLYQVIKEIESRCEKFNIPKSVIDNAKILYKHI